MEYFSSKQRIPCPDRSTCILHPATNIHYITLMTTSEPRMDPLTEHLDPTAIRGRKVCVSGRLVLMNHAEMAELVAVCGGTYVRYPTRSSLLIVSGAAGWPEDHHQPAPTRVVKRACELKALGYAIEFASEDDFLEKLGLHDSADEIRGRHTIKDLSRILGVPGARIRRWIRAGLIEPVASTHPLVCFDFHQVAAAKHLAELVSSGTSLTKIGRGMEQAAELFCAAGEHSCLEFLARIEADGRFLIRVRDQLMDHLGQSYFDFEDTGCATVPGGPGLESGAEKTDSLFDTALSLEEAGRLAEAVGAYELAIEYAPRDAVLHFNLGNVLCELEQKVASAASYERAVQNDPHFAEAWNNLGNVCADLGRTDEALRALRQAVQLVPSYADAHYNLAEVLESASQTVASAQHRAAHRRFSTANRLLAGRKHVLRLITEAGESAD